MDMNMDMDLDMENFADYGSLNHLSNNGLSVTNIVDELDYFDDLMPAGCHSDDLFVSFFDENKSDSMICNADTVDIPNGQRSTKKSLFDLDSDVVDEIDLVAWKDKEKEEWNRIDTINWILLTGVKFGRSFASMSPGLALPGKELLKLSEREFIMYDRDFGKKLFELLHKGRESEKHQNPLDDFESTDSEDEVLPDDKPAPDLNIKRLPGRPRIIDKKTKQPRKKLPEFIADALLNPELCPRVIRWDNYEEKTFHIVDPAKMSEIWGERNNKENSSMNFEKFSRAMRYYYKKDVLQSVPSKLVYKFGENATGWQTDCPNFDPNYFSNKVKSEP